jgi:hypothetical protein
LNTETKSVTGKVMMELTEKEAKLIDEARSTPYGRFTVIMENGQPVRIEQSRPSKKL